MKTSDSEVPLSHAAADANSKNPKGSPSQRTTAKTVTNKPVLPLPQAAIDLLGSRYRQISSPGVAYQIWTRCFTETERQELGNNVEQAYKSGIVGMWRRVRGGDRYGIAVKIAFWLDLLTRSDYEWLLRLLGQAARGGSSARLVIVEYPREVFWKHKKVKIRWEANSSPWNYLVTLAEHAQQGKSIDYLSLRSEVEPYYLSKLKSRLRRMDGFPASLADCIKKAGPGSQRLEIEPGQVVIVRCDD